MTDESRRVPLPSRRSRLLVVLVSLLLFAVVPSHALTPDLVASSENGVTVTLSAGEPMIQTVEFDGVEYSVVSIPGTRLTGEPGAPELPCVRAVVGVPLCDAVELEVTTGGTHRLSGVRVIPAPGLEAGREGELSGYPRNEGAVYSSSEIWPAGAARVTGPRWLGPQRTVTVEFYPCRYAPDTGELIIHESVDVTLRFRGVRVERGGPRQGSVASPRQERMLETVLLNSESARGWRRSGPLAERSRPDDYYSTSQNWVRMRITERGMYSVDYDDLSSIGVGSSNVDPETFRVFTGGGLSLPPGLDDSRPDWMQECTILVDGEGDGSFDSGDAVVFYALAADGWADEYGIVDPDEPYHENHYANENIYWLTWEEQGVASGFAAVPLRMSDDDLQNSPMPLTMVAHHARRHFERNIVSKQGRSDNWYWHDMTISESWRYFHETLGGVVTDSLGILRVRVDGNSATGGVYPDHHVKFQLNSVDAFDAYWDAYGEFRFEADSLVINNGYNTFAVNIPRDIPGVDDEAILIDWFEIIYWKELAA
ncbi:hypothetical protein K8S17_06380, partial [bacterium]|nr:hypothetical protein [bacterium]